MEYNKKYVFDLQTFNNSQNEFGPCSLNYYTFIVITNTGKSYYFNRKAYVASVQNQYDGPYYKVLKNIEEYQIRERRIFPTWFLGREKQSETQSDSQRPPFRPFSTLTPSCHDHG